MTDDAPFRHGEPSSSGPLRPARVESIYLAAPLRQPRRNAFGEMSVRPMLMVRLVDQDGAEGWGECFCNWPEFGAAHRKRIIDELLTPLLISKSFDHPSDLAAWLNERTRSLRIQCNEPGPFEQTIAALDIAAWDLAARRAGLPLADYLSATPVERDVPVYASALSETNLDDAVRSSIDRGIGAFKLKVGFGEDADRRTLKRLRDSVGERARLMADANQAWTPEQAATMIDALADFDLEWIEEPISAEADLEVWRTLADRSRTPIAAGENIRGGKAFSAMVRNKVASVIQPDVIKWGGITGCRDVAIEALRACLRFCPHYLGGGIGLLASAHLLASLATGDLLELDVSENPWINSLDEDSLAISSGSLTLSPQPGLGLTPNLDRLRPYIVATS